MQLMVSDVPILTKPEIRKDIREIQRTTIEDSDSECSVKSEDIHDDRNSYPVKPRKAPRWARHRHPAPLVPGE